MTRTLVKNLGQSVRNYIINGNFDFWQRGITATDTKLASSLQYRADRFQADTTGAHPATIFQEQSFVVPTISDGVVPQYSLKITSSVGGAPAANDYSRILYNMEGLDLAEIKNKIITVSFWVRSSVTGTYTLNFANGVENRTYMATYTINTADTWEKKIVSVDLSQSNGTWVFTTAAGLRLGWILSAGSNRTTAANTWASTSGKVAATGQVNWAASNGNTFYLAQVMLNEGPAAAPFQRVGASIAEELTLCQRYFEKSFPINTAPIVNYGSDGIWKMCLPTAGGPKSWASSLEYAVPKRSTPSITFYNPDAASNTVRFYAAGLVSSDLTGVLESSTEYQFDVTTGTGGGYGDKYAAKFHFTAAAEL